MKYVLASRAIMALPVSGMVLRWLGVQSVDANNLRRHMKEGNTIALLPGGFEEATLTSNTKERVFIKKRKGFIKYSL